MKRLLYIFATLFFLVFARQANALTLLPSCQDKDCAYQISNIKIGTINDNSTSAETRGKVIGKFVNDEKINISWDVVKKDTSNKKLVKYRFSYGCSPTPDIDNIDKTWETTEKMEVFPIPRNDLSAKCFCKVWVSIRDKENEDIKLGGANSRPFQICPNPPKIVLPELETKKITDSNIKGKKIISFNGRLLNLGNDSSVQTYYKIGTQSEWLKENQNSTIFIKDPQKRYLSSPINYPAGIPGLDMSSKNLGYCYRIEGSNRAGKASGGTRCFPSDDIVITTPAIQSIDYKLETDPKGKSRTLLKASFIADDVGGSLNAIAQNWVDEGDGKFFKYEEIKNIKEGKQYSFGNVSVDQNFRYKIVLINEDGKDSKQENVSVGKYSISIDKIDPQNSKQVILNGSFEDIVKDSGVGFKNIIGYYAIVWRDDGKESAEGFCPTEFVTYEQTPIFKTFKMNIASKSGSVCNFEAGVKYNVKLVGKFRYTEKKNDFIEIFSDVQSFQFIPTNPELTADFSTKDRAVNIKVNVKKPNFNSLMKISYLIRPLYPGDNCMFLNSFEEDDQDLLKKYSIREIVTGSRIIDITKNIQPFDVYVDMSNRIYCVILQANITDSEGRILNSPFVFSKITVVTEPRSPDIEMFDINDDDKTWGGAKVKAVLKSTGVDTDQKPFDGKIDDEAKQAKIKFSWRYGSSNKFYELENYSEPIYQKSKDDSGEISSAINQFDLRDPKKAGENYTKNIVLKDTQICVYAKAENNAGLNNNGVAQAKCFYSFYKPSAEPISVYSLGGSKILVKGRIISKGNALNNDLKIVLIKHWWENNSLCKNAEISIDNIALKDGVDTSKLKDGDTFELIVDLSKASQGPNKIPNDVSCSYLLGTFIGLRSKSLNFNEDSFQKTEKENMIPFSTGVVGAKLPKEHKQTDYPCLESAGCSTTSYMDLVHFWYFNNKAVRTAYNKFIGASVDNNAFSASNFLNEFYGRRCDRCGVYSIKTTLREAKIPLRLINIKYDLSGISSNTNDKKSYEEREEIIRDMYEKALSNNWPVVVRTMREGSQHYFVVKGIYFNTANGVPNRDENGKIIFNDADKIYIADTFYNTHPAIKKDDLVNGWYIYKKDFLGDYKCLVSDREYNSRGEDISGDLVFAYYLSPE